MRRHRMAQQVGRARLVHASEVHVALDVLGHELRADLFAVVSDEQRIDLGGDQQRPRFQQVAVEPGQRPLANRHHPVLRALTLAHEQQAPVRVHVVAGQPRHFPCRATQQSTCLVVGSDPVASILLLPLLSN
jgi:hypothetical protein